MKKTNDTYCIKLSRKKTIEYYYRDENGWIKVSCKGRKFRATAEQVLNHLLPALVFDDLRLTISVEHYDDAYWKTLKGE